MSARDFGAFLDSSLDLLEREVPRASDRLAAALGSSVVHFDAEEGTFVLQMQKHRRVLPRSGDTADITLGLTREVVVDLVEGSISLEEALFTDRLSLRGPVDRLGDFFDALHAYLEGAVRAPSFPQLFEAYRRGEAIPPVGEEE